MEKRMQQEPGKKNLIFSNGEGVTVTLPTGDKSKQG